MRGDPLRPAAPGPGLRRPAPGRHARVDRGGSGGLRLPGRWAGPGDARAGPPADRRVRHRSQPGGADPWPGHLPGQRRRHRTAGCRGDRAGASGVRPHLHPERRRPGRAGRPGRPECSAAPQGRRRLPPGRQRRRPADPAVPAPRLPAGGPDGARALAGLRGAGRRGDGRFGRRSPGRGSGRGRRLADDGVAGGGEQRGPGRERDPARRHHRPRRAAGLHAQPSRRGRGRWGRGGAASLPGQRDGRGPGGRAGSGGPADAGDGVHHPRGRPPSDARRDAPQHGLHVRGRVRGGPGARRSLVRGRGLHRHPRLRRERGGGRRRTGLGLRAQLHPARGGPAGRPGAVRHRLPRRYWRALRLLRPGNGGVGGGEQRAGGRDHAHGGRPAGADGRHLRPGRRRRGRTTGAGGRRRGHAGRTRHHRARAPRAGRAVPGWAGGRARPALAGAVHPLLALRPELALRAAGRRHCARTHTADRGPVPRGSLPGGGLHHRV